ncbi:MAG: hypothetical protein HOP33_10320 [Verrucomicrobia bacterium]|nr:hypothetical protein [Verrucomicrobiota bacterium]
MMAVGSEFMRRIPVTICAVFILSILVIACDRKSKVPAGSSKRATSQELHNAISNKDELRRILIRGMPTNEIIVALGQPGWVQDLGTGKQLWHHSLRPFAENDFAQGDNDYFVTGVTVGITNGHLADWGFVTTGVPKSRKENILYQANTLLDSADLKFFVVSNKPVPDGRLIDTDRFPKLGFIGGSPTVRIRRLKELTLKEQVFSEGQGRTNWSLSIVLNSEDAPQLEALTETNISMKVLIMIGNEFISAPVITVPVSTGRFGVDFEDRSLMESIKKQLAELQRQSQ